MESFDSSEQLDLGEEFKDKICLTVSEVAHMLIRKKEELEKEPQSDYINDVFDKSLTYARRFGGGLSEETTKAIKSYLTRVKLTTKTSERKNLQTFEVAELANLMPGDAEEALTLIPSLREFEEKEVEKLLKELESLKGI